MARVFRFGLVVAAVAGFWLFATGTASAAAPSPPFTQCPHIGFDTSCAILIYIDDNGAQLLTDPSQGPYDNVEDTLIGVVNNTTSTTISSIPITGSAQIFGFDQDGACDPNNPTTPFSPGPPDANPGVGPCTDNSVDTTGYGGPNSYFTNINGAKTAGTVNFIAALAPGGHSTWFSLEEKITGADLNVITATSVPISAVEGNPFSGPVATLHATDTSAPASQFTATVTWSDDGSTSPGTVTGGSGTFTVSGTHTFVDEGSYTATVTITDMSNGNTTTVTSPATVADAPLTAGALTLSTTGVEGVTPTTATFAFTDANPLATTADFTATIDWGDSSPATVGTVSGGAGSFTVAGSHQYTEEGTYNVTVTVNDDGGSTTGASGSATVNDAPLSSACAIAANSPQAFSGATLTFTDANPGGTLSDFTATIDWGDTHVTSGTVSGPSAGVFTVSGSHTYTSTGFFNVTTTVNDVGGSKTSQKCQTLIFAFAPGGGAFVIGDQNSAIGTVVTFWGAQWSKLNTLSGGSAPAAFKGFAPDPAAPSCGVGWSSNPGNSTPPPAGPLPAYMAVIVSSSITQSGSAISGDTFQIVIVKTNSGYAPNAGHAGTGTVVSVVC